MTRRINLSVTSHETNSSHDSVFYVCIYSINQDGGDDSLKYQTVFSFLGESWFPPPAAHLPQRLGLEAEEYDPREKTGCKARSFHE